MKKTTILVLFLSIFLFSTQAQDRMIIKLKDFSSIAVNGRIKCKLVHSDLDEMTIASSIGSPADVDVSYKDGELRLKIGPNLGKDVDYEIKLPYKAITRIEASGGAVISF